MMTRSTVLSFVLSLVLISVIEAEDRYHHHDEHLPVQLYYTDNSGYQQPRRHRRHASASSSNSGSGYSSSSSNAHSGSFSGGGGGGGEFAFPQGFGQEEFQRQYNEFQNYMQQVSNAHNSFDGAGAVPIPNGLDARFGGASYSSPGGSGGFAFPSATSFSAPGGTHGASATAQIGPNGGYGQADLQGGLGARFGGESAGGPFPSTGGSNAPVGIFTSSSSGSSDINGKKSGFKEATSGVIGADGKVQGYTVRKGA